MPQGCGIGSRLEVIMKIQKAAGPEEAGKITAKRLVKLGKRSHLLIAASLIAAVWLVASPVTGQQVTRETVPGVTNFAHVESTVACAGAITIEAIPRIKKMGYASIINLREASEPGANVEAEAAAAKAAGIPYFYIPVNSASLTIVSPDVYAVDRFMQVITTEGTEPAFIHCGGGNRAAMMWFIKRLVVDHWDEETAEKEAVALGMTSAALKEFAIKYAREYEQYLEDKAC